MITAAFEAGHTRCLVGTRGIFGEGWDAPALNTLIDLTAVTTRTSVQQIRGRTLRLSPLWPRKVAHNWDVICLAPQWERGDGDLRRFERRHLHLWGATGDGDIVRGVGHIDEKLAFELATKDWRTLDYSDYSARQLEMITEREKFAALWKIGEEYEGREVSFARLQPQESKFRTGFTVENSLRRIARLFATMQWREARRAGKAFLQGRPSNAILYDAGLAVCAALREAKLIGTQQTMENLRVETLDDGSCRVWLEGANADDARTFIVAFRQLFHRARHQRYLISFNATREKDKPEYYPVPEALGERRELADIFARHWARRVGGGELVFTRGEAGKKALREARSRQATHAPELAFDVWI